MRSRLEIKIVFLLLAPVTAVALNGCDGTPASGVTCGADLGTTEAGQKVRLFVETADALVKAANAIDADMKSACIGMAQDLGIPAAEYAPPLGMEMAAGAATRAACTRVNSEIQSILTNDVPTTAKLAIVYTPAVCTIDAHAQTLCVQRCEPKTVTVTELMCNPGHFYGQCSATCMGTCGGSCSATCQGQCTATCNGTCSGHCNGKCMGTCAAMNADGTCFGACNGTCMGTCDATCTGTCSGSCNGTCSATCSGGCQGDCMIWAQPPQCTEVKKEVTVDECQTTCESQAKFEATCTEPSLFVSFGVSPHKPSVDKLVTALKNHYGLLLKVALRTGTTIGTSAAGFQVALSGVTTYAQMVGGEAIVCAADAISAVSKSATQIDVSASFSVMISASATATGSAAAP
jgi:hypothetical protein